MMGHDYAHCADYDEATCPQICFRGQLVRDYRDRVHTDMQGVPVYWMHLRGTTECVGVHNIATYVPIRVRTNGDRIREMTDEELAAALCLIAGGQGPLPNVQSLIASYWLDWLKQEAKDD